MYNANVGTRYLLVNISYPRRKGWERGISVSMMKNKKNKKCMIILCMCVTLALSACGMRTAGKNDAASTAADRMEEIRRMHAKKAGQETRAERKASHRQEEKEVVFGSKTAGGYEDFKYLTELVISVPEAESEGKTDFSVYVPMSKYADVYDTAVRSENAGVYIRVDFEPDLPVKAENNSVRNKLEKYIDAMVTYYTNCYNIDVSKIENIDKDSVVCEISYMKYDSYEDTYAPYYELYGLYDLGDDFTALVTVVIDADNTTKETEEMIEELSSFYRFDIHWDESFAQAKRDKFNESHNKNRRRENNRYDNPGGGNTYDMELISFTLPNMWKIDEYMSENEYDDYGVLAFEPDGETEDSALYLYIMEAGPAFGMIELWLEDMDEMKALYEEEFEDCEVTIEDIGLTFLGRTVVTEITVYEDSVYEDYMASVSIVYLAEDDDNAYMISAGYLLSFDEEVNAKREAQVWDALNMFFDTGYVKGGI